MSRRTDDAYFTVDRVAVAITRRVREILPAPARIIEPTAGEGAFVFAAHTVWGLAQIAAVDLAGKHRDACLKAGASKFFVADFLRVDQKEIARSDLVIGNPPYSSAEEIIRHAHAGLLPGGSIAFLLRLNFLAGQDRWGLLGREGLFQVAPLRYVAPIAPRPSFTLDGKTDSTEYGLFVWTKDYLDNATLGEAIVWRKLERP